MYVCICKAVSDSAIWQSVSEGVNNFRELSANTGCGTQCGCCVKLARKVMHKALGEGGSTLSKVEPEVVSSV